MDANLFARKHKAAVDLYMRIFHGQDTIPGWDDMSQKEIKKMVDACSKDLDEMYFYVRQQEGKDALPGARCQLCERPILIEFESSGLDHLCRHCADQLNRYPSND